MALIAAFISDVELYILDEPTSGLDPLMEIVFRECIAEVKKEGKTVLLSSHILAEVEKLCDRISIIKAGKIVESGTLADLRHLTGTSVTVKLAPRSPGLKSLPGVHDPVVDGNTPGSTWIRRAGRCIAIFDQVRRSFAQQRPAHARGAVHAPL